MSAANHQENPGWQLMVRRQDYEKRLPRVFKGFVLFVMDGLLTASIGNQSPHPNWQMWGGLVLTGITGVLTINEAVHVQQDEYYIERLKEALYAGGSVFERSPEQPVQELPPSPPSVTAESQVA